MMLLGALLALSSCAKSAGVAAVSGLNPTDGSNTTDTTPEFTGMQAADEIENEDPRQKSRTRRTLQETRFSSKPDRHREQTHKGP